MKSVQKHWAQEAIKKLKHYPDPIPTSRYVRTFDLRDGWQLSGPAESGSGIRTSIFNDMDYAGYVYGDEQGSGQVAVHQGRWIMLVDAVDREGYLDALREVMRDNIGS